MTGKEIYEYFLAKRERELCFGLVNDSEIETFESNGYKYTMKYQDNEPCFILTSWPQDVEVLIVEDFVTEIHSNLLEVNTTLKEVRLNDICTRIEECSFTGCKSLEKINLDNVEYIGKGAFRGCHSLKEVNFGPKLRFLGNRAFAESGLVHVKFNSRLDSLCSSCFSYCLDLKTVENLHCYVDVKEQTREIQGMHGAIFRCCINLKEVSIVNLNYITDDCFWYCSNLKYIKVQDYSSTIVGDNAFFGCTDVLLDYKGVQTVISNNTDFRTLFISEG